MNPIPAHIAIIMDGNGRWAVSRGLPRVEGHRKGIEAVENITIACSDLGVKFLTLYAFSEENWDRPLEEVRALMGLMVEFLKLKKQKLIDNQIKFMTIGDNDRLPQEVRDVIKDVERATVHLSKTTMIVALSYGSRMELCRAIQRAVDAKVTEITPETLSPFLDTAGIPDPDLLIRTSGEHRVSNFLLWQIAYSEFYFTQKLWPDFSKEDLERAIKDYQNRERRFGKTSEQWQKG
ncbi:MAG: isoprenyl transferase [Deltaproteobacteria bacterium CG11_big_fil_rev_8_21_14_0_20_49_13]|nr:MAG: isoprenyl transferase [Deltaproteobacteria bacterium CG11_big_fil_rev_8_21_14_0_20_49_13]